MIVATKIIIIITYDLRTPKDYHNFYEAIKAQGEQGKWWHYMASTWLLSTTKTPQEVSAAIQPHLDPQDLLFVCQLTPNYQGWLPKPAWDWIQAELAQQIDYASIFGNLSGIGGAMTPAPTVTPTSFLEALTKIPPPPKPK